MKKVFAISMIVIFSFIGTALAEGPGPVYPGTCEGKNGFECNYKGTSAGYILTISSPQTPAPASVEVIHYFEIERMGMKLYPAIEFDKPGTKKNPGGGVLEYKLYQGRIELHDELIGLTKMRSLELTVKIDNKEACKAKITERAR